MVWHSVSDRKIFHPDEKKLIWEQPQLKKRKTFLISKSQSVFFNEKFATFVTIYTLSIAMAHSSLDTIAQNHLLPKALLE